MTDTNKIRGRKRKEFNWPTGEFKISDIFKSGISNMSRVTLQERVNSDIELGKLKIVSKLKNKTGRPERVLSLV